MKCTVFNKELTTPYIQQQTLQCPDWRYRRGCMRRQGRDEQLQYVSSPAPDHVLPRERCFSSSFQPQDSSLSASNFFKRSRSPLETSWGTCRWMLLSVRQESRFTPVILTQSTGSKTKHTWCCILSSNVCSLLSVISRLIGCFDIHEYRFYWSFTFKDTKRGQIERS